MAVFRVEKTRDFTVMSNHHLRNRNLSLKAKGLLSLMLSLPEEWDYTLKGLAHISKEGVDAIRVAVNELEKAGYIERRCLRNCKGQLGDTEYLIHEQPILSNPTLEEPILENPTLEIPTQEKPTLKNPTQLNINKSNTQKINTDVIKYPSINPAQQENSEEPLIDRYNKTIVQIKEQIDYYSLISTNDADIINNIINVMADAMLLDIPYFEIENKKIPSELVRIRYRQINYRSLDAFLVEFSKVYYKINNPKAYLTTALYNVALTAGTALSNRVNHDMYGGASNG